MSNTTIQLRKSGQTGNTPADLAHGELAINYADGKLFYKNGVGIKSIENQKTFSTVNSNNSLIIATSPTDILNIVPGTNITISTNTTSKTITINSTASGGGGGDDIVARELAQGAFTAANTAASNTVYLQAVNDLQNTNITSVNTFVGSSFNSANAGVTLATAAYAQANSASSNTVYLNEINTLQNTNITSVNTFAASAFNSANAGVTLATAGYNQANNASSNTIYLQSINDLQNTNITSVNTFAGSAFNSANAGVTLATAAYAEANNASGNTVALQAQMTTTNTNIGYTDTLATAAYGKANAEGAINNTQNNWIASTNTFAQAAYNTANLKFNTTGGTITGNVTIQNNLVVEGNLTVLGNSTTITTDSLSITDSLIFLANGNITTDALDIGFVGHYGGPSGETHTGFFRDPIQKEWILFEGYTQQVLSNTLINIANPTFAYANLYANVVKANLISTRATVNGLDVYNTMTNAWNSANAGVILATASYDKANGAVQTGFTTISANSVNITPSSNTDTLTITAGNNISISACTTTKTITIASTASGGYSNTDVKVYLESLSNVNIGLSTGNNQGSGAISIGSGAGQYLQGNNSIAIGLEAGRGVDSVRGQGDGAVAIGIGAGRTNQDYNAVAIGTGAGYLNQFASAVAIGENAGQATQGNNAIAIGIAAAYQNQKDNSIAIGRQAGQYNQSEKAVAIGYQAGQYDQAASSIIISANGELNSTTTGFFVDPVRNVSSNNVLYYNPTTKEITFGAASSGGGSGALTYDTAPPASGNTVGDRWVDSEDGTLYTYINDGNSSQWVDFSTAATPASVGGGTANAILYQAGVGNTTFTSVGSQGQLLTAGVAGVPIWAAQTALSIANTQITGLITNAQLAGPLGVTVTNETANSSTFYPLFSDIISGTLAIADVSSTKLTYVPSTGTLSATVVTSTSDEKLKTNISTIQDPINIIKQLRGVEYNWKDNGQKSMGVIAQEVEKILPYLVSENENSKSVMYSNMVGLLIEAIKEQQKQIDELRGKLNAD